MKKALLLKTTLALALAAPMLASAESELIVGSGSADASLDFRVTIPRVLFLAVGPGSAGSGLANNATIDLLNFDYTATPADVGSGTASAGQAVNVRVRGNNGQISLTAATSGALTNAATPSDTIPWSQITSSSSLAGLPSPVIPATGTGAGVNVTPTSGTKVTSSTAVWTFQYANAAIVPAGVYGTTNGRVTYTASMP